MRAHHHFVAACRPNIIHQYSYQSSACIEQLYFYMAQNRDGIGDGRAAGKWIWIILSQRIAAAGALINGSIDCCHRRCSTYNGIDGYGTEGSIAWTGINVRDAGEIKCL